MSISIIVLMLVAAAAVPLAIARDKEAYRPSRVPVRAARNLR